MIHCAAIKFMNMVTNPDKCYGMKLLSLSLSFYGTRSLTVLLLTMILPGYKI